MCQDPASAACCLEVPPGLTHWVLSQSLSQDCAEPPGWAAGGVISLSTQEFLPKGRR